jgi:error-prone DNA polymerase
MGFYSPDQVLQDARRHRIQTRPVDVLHSDWDCSLEDHGEAQPAIRLGLRMIKGFREDDGQRIAQARAQRSFTDVSDLASRARLESAALERLADAGALLALAGHRHQARWEVASVQAQLPLFASAPALQEVVVALPIPSAGQNLHADYASVGTTLGPHPLALLRTRLERLRCRSSRALAEVEHGRPVIVTGLVVGRQRPGTASGVTFVTLEDEFGMINVVVWRDLAERQRRALVGSQLLQVRGRLERVGEVRHVIAGYLQDMTALLHGLDVRSRDFH